MTDPAAGGNYRYTMTRVSRSTAFAAGTRAVVLRPAKTWLTGTLGVFCQITARPPRTTCNVRSARTATRWEPRPPGRAGRSRCPSAATPSECRSQARARAGGAGRSASPRTSSAGGRPTTLRASVCSLRAPAAPPSNPVPPPSGGGGGAPGGFELGGQVSDFSAPGPDEYAGMTWVKRQLRWAPGRGRRREPDQRRARQRLQDSAERAGESGRHRRTARTTTTTRAYVGELARLGADAIEVWNEMNIDREWPAGQINPADVHRPLAPRV